MQNKDDWKIDGGLLYRLDENGVNYHEINVTLAHGSRFNDARFVMASELLVMICREKETPEADAFPNDTKLMIAIHAYASTASKVGLPAAFHSKEYKVLAEMMQIRYPHRLPDGWRR